AGLCVCKQKRSYEFFTCWSSDVCSSDLGLGRLLQHEVGAVHRCAPPPGELTDADAAGEPVRQPALPRGLGAAEHPDDLLPAGRRDRKSVVQGESVGHGKTQAWET